MYKYFLKPLLFLLSPESAHHYVFSTLKFFFRAPGIAAATRSCYAVNDPRLEKNVFGLKFPNPVGLAAGFDKDAKLFDELACFGFGFIEVGTVTPKPQPGNPKPRMFRLVKDEALINRMGFNNEGVEEMIKRLKQRKNKRVIIGGNIGKNKDTPNQNALSDYEYCFGKLYDHVDYFVVNVSSPNTPGLRELQEKEPLKKILLRLIELRSQKPAASGRKPILLKIAPDLTNTQLHDIVEIVRETKIDGVVATNTTISRDDLRTTNSELTGIGSGGLSGKPLSPRSTEVIQCLHDRSGGSFPIIASGGIHTAEDAIEKLNAGASLVQVYTGFVYEGPCIAKKINKGILGWKN